MFKYIVLALSIASFIACEPQNYYSNYESAPYQPSGWRPSGPAFRLPERLQNPQTIYGPPEIPEEPTTESIDTTTTEIPTTTAVESENLSEKLRDGEQGVYYIYHPTGLLQKITYATKDDVQDMAYYARIKYEDVEPIKDPIFTYDPTTAELKRIARKVEST
ncbi:hypothetical protein HHI36_021063 [Cryptolaemus montrouzieri]|uniref:DUF4794 domain-containing protein n=1 Tax=Cryptolaemus montrouzieri TaxID=559131 RepID=A0ABD2MVU6_9CUCU